MLGTEFCKYMYKILTLNNISVAGLDRLPLDSYEISSEIRNPDVILLRSFRMHDMEIPGTLKAVGRAGAGVNNIPVDAMSERGIPVFNAPGANANAVKELVLAAMLISCRNIAQAWDFVRSLPGDDGEISKQVEVGKKKFGGFELPGRVLGVIGLGAIGVEVANAAVFLDMKVVGFDPGVTVQRAWQLSSEVEQATSVDDMLSKVDFVTFHVPLIDTTANMINEDRIRLMKPEAVIMNFARDGIIDDEAVVRALDEQRLYAYICDFPSNLLKRHPRVVTLPHLGASTREAEDNCAAMVAEQLKDYLENGNIKNSVNFPAVKLPRVASSYRLAVVNSNVPDMVGRITHALGGTGHNIMHMVNESRGEIAYTLMDLNATVPQELVNAICSIDGVLSARAL